MGDLSHYCALARGQRGRAVRAIVSEALTDPRVFVFGELLDVPSVADLACCAEGAQTLELLRVFAYGSLADYQAAQSQLPELNPLQLHKLKQLTLVALAAESRVLGYDDLLAALSIADVRELEDVVIDAITNDLLNAKLDQGKRQVEVLDVIGRDVRREDIGKMVEKLSLWYDDSVGVMKQLERVMEDAAHQHQNKELHVQKHAESVQKQRSLVKAEMAAGDHDGRFGAGGGDGGEDEDYGRRYQGLSARAGGSAGSRRRSGDF
eukprot:TRINITY_DN14863_c0_g1_i1.p1 TRINITY_DN14863_c0_g1~~TRINITY_DN14863_c0_g1_i1.p1  ORF type:complete len:264 (+),score=81.59 TRINITY_DN14863_c0_g1_i1:62-853(+)